MNLNDPALAQRLDTLIDDLKIEAFVETGTGYGVSLEWAYGKGLHCWTCDVELRQIAPAKQRFPRAHVYYMESVEFLLRACAVIEAPALFWLDAHDAHPADGVGPLWPLADELAIVAKRNGKDAILIDDVDDPRFDVQAYVAPFLETHTWSVTDGILWMVPR